MRHKLWKLLTLTFFSLSLFTPFSCQEDEIDSSNALNQQEIELYKNKILYYTNKLSHSLSNPNSRTQVQNIETNIDFNTMEVHKLSNLEQVITADFAINTNHRGIEGKSKYLFFIHDNQIMRSKIITFNDNGFTNYNELLLSVLDRKHKKPNYTGTITLSSITNKKIHQTTYSNGKLIRYASVMVKKKNDSQQSRGTECYSYYWVTRDIEGNESWEYLYTDCTQDQVPYDEGGGGGGGGGGDNLNYTPTFPSNPKNNQIYNFYDPYGTYIQYKYNATTNVWQIASVQIAAITITSNPYSTPYPYLLLTTPIHGQEVKSPDGLLFTYDANSGFWHGEPYEAKTPCESTNQRLNSLRYQVKQDELSTKYNLQNETGFRENTDGSFSTLPNGTNGWNSNSIEMKITSTTVGYNHTHVNTYTDADGQEIKPIHMLSPMDLQAFYVLLMNCYRYNISTDRAYVQMTSSTGTYSFAFEGTYEDLLNFSSSNTIDLSSAKTEKDFKKYIKDYGNEVGLLKFIKDKANINGLKLLKINNDDTIETINLDTNNKPIRSNCN